MKKIYNNYQIGAHPPFLNHSNACYQRLGRALILTSSELGNSCSVGGTFIASVSIPNGKEQEFETICKAKLSRHPTIHFGDNVLEPILFYEK